MNEIMYEKNEMMFYPHQQENSESPTLYYLKTIQFKGEWMCTIFPQKNVMWRAKWSYDLNF